MMNDIRSLYLTVPEWQGSGKTNELYYGAQNLQAIFGSNCNVPLHTVPVEKELCSGVENGILGYEQIVEQIKAAKQLLLDSKPDKIFTMGGSCGSDIMPISFLNSIHDNFALLWFDAHADLNTPATSPSKHFHGMPLRTLLGEGDEAICNLLFSTLEPSQVFLIGTRDIDLPEKQFIQSRNMFSVDIENIEDLFRFLMASKFRNIYIRIDLDVLDPQQFPWVKCPTSGGLQLNQLCKTLQTINSLFNQVGFGLMEFVPRGKKGSPEITEIIRSGLSF